MTKGLRNQPFTDGVLRQVAMRLPKSEFFLSLLSGSFAKVLIMSKQIWQNLLPFLESTLTRLRDTETKF